MQIVELWFLPFFTIVYLKQQQQQRTQNSSQISS